MALTFQEASQELFTDNYRPWESASPARNASNAPNGCSEISQATANALRGQWNPGSNPNDWNQTMATGHTVQSNNVRRWVTRSVTGGGTVVDFHAYWSGIRFLRHFKLV